MEKIKPENIYLFKSLRENIKNSIMNSSFKPEYIKVAENILPGVSGFVWSIDYPSTIYLNLVRYYNNQDVFNMFFEKYDRNIAYDLFMFNYFVRRCALIHTCGLISEDEIDILKKYVSIFNGYNIGRFDRETFLKRTIKDLKHFESSNIESNMAYIDKIYNKEMLKNNIENPLIFNYPDFCNDFSELDYSRQFYDNDYELFWSISKEYIKKRNYTVDLANILEVFEVINIDGIADKEHEGKVKGGISKNRFERFVRHYG